MKLNIHCLWFLLELILLFGLAALELNKSSTLQISLYIELWPVKSARFCHCLCVFVPTIRGCLAEISPSASLSTPISKDLLNHKQFNLHSRNFIKWIITALSSARGKHEVIWMDTSPEPISLCNNRRQLLVPNKVEEARGLNVDKDDGTKGL